MSVFDSLMAGFQVALSYNNLLYCTLGVVIGTAIGVMPGLGPVATISLLLPLTYKIPTEAAIIMLAGIYYGAMYGGSTTSILINLPGEAASVITTLDGYQMAKQGRAGAALGISAIASFVAGTIAVIGLSFLAPVLVNYAIKLGPPEYTSLMVLGLLLVIYMTTKSPVKSIIATAVGLLVSCIGLDPITAVPRLTFDLIDLRSGVAFSSIAMGLFGVGEILTNLDKAEEMQLVTNKIGNIWPSLTDLITSKWAIVRGSIIGFFIGILPGGGGIIASLVAYSVEKNISKHPEKFGKGAIEGVAAPEAANNAAAESSFIPLLTLGIPTNAVMALMFGALLIHGVTPGPFLITEHPNLFWGVICSMYIGNFILIILNLPLVGLFVQLLRVRFPILAPFVILITLIGVYSIDNSIFDMWLVLVSGVIGYVMRKFGYEPGPLILALVIGPILETSFRQALLMSNGDPLIFLYRPVSAFFLIAGVLLMLFQYIKQRSRKDLLPQKL